MTNTKELIIQLKEVREEKNLSFNDIMKLMEKNNDFLSKSTLSRVFAKGSEDKTFMYEETIRPIATALLDIDEIEEDDSADTKAMKTFLQFKKGYIRELEERVEELEAELDHEKVKSHEKLDDARQQWNKTTEFLKEQISLKDQRMDLLLKAVVEKDTLHKEMLDKFMTCPCRKAVDS